MRRIGAIIVGVLLSIGLPSHAADFPAPKEGSWIAKDFRFHTGEVLADLRLHYTTVGASTGEPVLVLHGTTGSGSLARLQPVARPGTDPGCIAGGERRR